MRYTCPYLHELDEAINHAERVINGSSDPDGVEWFKRYRSDLLRRMIRHQLIEFQK